MCTSSMPSAAAAAATASTTRVVSAAGGGDQRVLHEHPHEVLGAAASTHLLGPLLQLTDLVAHIHAILLRHLPHLQQHPQTQHSSASAAVGFSSFSPVTCRTGRAKRQCTRLDAAISPSGARILCCAVSRRRSASGPPPPPATTRRGDRGAPTPAHLPDPVVQLHQWLLKIKNRGVGGLCLHRAEARQNGLQPLLAALALIPRLGHIRRLRLDFSLRLDR